MAQAPLNRYDVIHYKRDDCSFEDFAHFFTKEYPLRAGPIIKKYGIVQWASTIHYPKDRERQREITKNLGHQWWTVPDYDFTMSYWTRDPMNLVRLCTDPEWVELQKDSMPKMKTELGHFVVGQQTVHFGSAEANGI